MDKYRLARPPCGHVKKWIWCNYLKRLGKTIGVSKKIEKIKRPEKVYIQKWHMQFLAKNDYKCQKTSRISRLSRIRLFQAFWIWIRPRCGHTLARPLPVAFTPHLWHPCNIVACPPCGHALARRLRVACAPLVASTLRPDVVCTFRMSLGCRCNRESFAGVGGWGCRARATPLYCYSTPRKQFLFFPKLRNPCCPPCNPVSFSLQRLTGCARSD